MKIRLAVAAAAALAAPILLPASHAFASTTHVASPAAVSHVNGGCCGFDVCGCGGGFEHFGGGCFHGCGGFSGGFAGFGGLEHFGGCGHECGFHVEHVDIDVSVHPFINPCLNPCGFGI